ncbi:UDP-glucuronosyltransferase 2B13 [Eumeta japonica]|uniref:UDP-glucuronosyltransferase 2B13 n=1 Tax=Eumeta variegata TaxID=151549 RepID=A0A4C1TNI4_EUMVA|nr:UDP-glucuronosyltransferase 2B13 [Eumeta japonica]
MMSQVAQTLTEYGEFAQYLHRFKPKDSPYCAYNPAKIQDVLHVLEEFPMFFRDHVALETEIGVIFVTQNFPKIIDTRKIRGKFMRFCNTVTYITPYPRKDPPPNLNQVVIEYPPEIQFSNLFSIEKILNNEISFKDFGLMFRWFFGYAEHFLNHENVQRLMNDKNQSFDLAIIEWLFLELNAGFAPLFQCPMIWASSMEPHWMVLRLVDEAANPAYVADSMSNNAPPFTFLQRAQELGMNILMKIMMKFMHVKCSWLYDEIFVPAGVRRGTAMPPLEEVIYNASFVLSNSHVSLGEPVRLPQNFIPIAGYHIDPKTKPLSEELKNIMDKAKEGVIYFSMGSNLKSKDIPDKMKKEFVEMFGQLNQTVIWKFEEALPDLPKNVFILEWAPQQSILAHPNCVLFITHGGLLSTTETVHYGVPIIGIPVFADQFVNVNRAVNKGFAKKVDLSYNTPKELKEAILEVLNDSSYRERVKHLSLIYHDRPVPPARQLVHWAEHAIKTRGAPHLRSRALMLPCYQKMYLDLATLVLALLLIRHIFRNKQIITYTRVSGVSKLPTDVLPATFAWCSVMITVTGRRIEIAYRTRNSVENRDKIRNRK